MSDLQIDQYVLAKTTKCKCGFSCLSEGNNCLCEVITQNRLAKVAKVKPTADLSCNYSFHLGKSSFCLCPTRVEIYKQYKK